jgi:general secretion pathway protein N
MFQLLATRHLGATLFLLVACAALALVALHEIDAPADDDAAPPAAAPTTPRQAPQPQSAGFALPPLESYAEVAQRPLFSPSRKPPPPDAARETLGNSSSFVLLGIVISERGKYTLIQHGRPPVTARLTEGQTLEGWTIQEIRPDRVTLQNAVTQQELKLKDVKDRPPGGAPPPVPPPVRR